MSILSSFIPFSFHQFVIPFDGLVFIHIDWLPFDLLECAVFSILVRRRSCKPFIIGIPREKRGAHVKDSANSPYRSLAEEWTKKLESLSAYI